MNKFTDSFFQTKKVIGMVHADALPGTPKNSYSISTIIDKAVQEAKFYEQCGLDAIIIENMHDVPYLNKKVGPEITTSITAMAIEIKQNISIPCGIQILAGANHEALAAAHASQCEFIRVEGFIYSHIADEGIMNADAGELLRYRKYIGAENIAIFTDIKKKHSSHKITQDIDIINFAKTAEFFLSDGIIITGNSTSQEASIEDVTKVNNNCQLPILIGSGITDKNIQQFWSKANAFIIGSHFKEDGKWYNPISKERVKNFINKIQKLR